MAQQLKVFVSHSHEDDAFCREVVGALRGAGADVWYDEHNLGSGQLVDTIERELRARPIVVVILSAAALRSPWVRDECTWAYSLMRRDPSRELLPVTASPIEEDAIWLFLSTFKRIEAPGLKPFPVSEVCGRLLHALALTPGAATRATPAPAPTPQPTARLDELLSQGKALVAQDKYVEAIPFLERATQLDPRSFDAWANLGYVYAELRRWLDGLAANDRALALDNKQASVWNNKGWALDALKRYEEALVCYDRALALDPKNVAAWSNKGAALNDLKRHEEALVAHDRALALDPNYVNAWTGTGNALVALKRYKGALTCYNRALTLDSTYANTWVGKGNTLWGLKQYQEAVTAYDRALALEPKNALAWNNKAISLHALGRKAEAEQAERRARELGWKG